MSIVLGIYNFGNVNTIKKQDIIAMLNSFSNRGTQRNFYLSDDNKIALAGVFSEGIELVSSEDKKIWAVCEGNIYNRRELKELLAKKGHSFQGNSEAEIIIHLYEEEGTGCFNSIDGEIIIALWDGRKNKLIVGRDRLGIKSIYYAYAGNKIIFASEIKGILAYPEFDVKLEEKALIYYFSLSYSPAPFTMFEGIYKIMPGYFVEFDSGGQSRKVQYWDIAYPDAYAEIREEKAIEKTRYLLEAAVKKRTTIEKPMGCFLSGGRDSTTVLALMSKFVNSQEINTFTIGFKNTSSPDSALPADLSAAREISRIFKTKHREIIIGSEDVVSSAPFIAEQLDDLFSFTSVFYSYAISKFAKDNGVLVVLCGDGEEEIFFGYTEAVKFYKIAMLLSKIFPNKFLKKMLLPAYSLAEALSSKSSLRANYLVAYTLECIKRFSRGQELYWGHGMPFLETERTDLFSDDFRKRHVNLDPYEAIENVIMGLNSKKQNCSIFEKMAYLDIKGWLAERHFMTVNRMAAVNALEARFPFLDLSLVEFTTAIPEKIRFRNQVSSYLYNKSIKGLIPDWVLDRGKSIFPLSMYQYLGSEFFPLAKETIFSSRILRRGYFNKTKIERIFSEHIKRRANNMYRIFALYLLCIWFDKWVKK